MFQYKYHIKDSQGNNYKGTERGNSVNNLAREFKEKGYYVITIKKARVISNLSFLFAKWPGREDKMTSQESMFIASHLAALLEGGVSLLDALKTISLQLKNKSLASSLERVCYHLQQGSSFHKALVKERRHFPALFINLSKIGEEGGRLEQVMRNIASSDKRDIDMKNKLSASMTYPMVLMVVASIVVTFITFNIMPAFAAIYSSMGADLPGTTSFLMGSGRFILLLFVLILTLACLFLYRGLKAGKSSSANAFIYRISSRVPIYGTLLEQAFLARLSRIMGLLLKSGVDLLTSLKLTAEAIENEKYRKNLLLIHNSVAGGDSILYSLAGHHIFPPVAKEMISVGEKIGALDEMMLKVADYYDEEVGITVNKLGTFIEPLVTIIMAVIVGVIALSVLLPMLNVYEML